MSERNLTIHISTASVFKVVLVLLLFVVIYLLRDLALVILTSVVLASAVEPATKWFSKYKVPRVAAVLFVYVAIIIGFAGIFYVFIPPLFNEVSSLTSNLPEYVQSLSPIDGAVVEPSAQGAQGLVGGLADTFSLEGAIKNIENTIAGLSSGVFQTVSTIFGGVFSFVLIIIISFYLAVQEKGIENFLRIITPIRHEDYIVDLWKRSQAKIGKWMQGQLLLGLLIGVLVYLGLTVLGIKYALTLALLAAIMELIPLFGPIIAAVPAVLLGFVSGPSTGLLVLGLYVIIQQFENHLIYPLVVRKVVGVPPLLVIIALIIGGKLVGFLGVLLSVPIAAAIIEFTDDIQKEKHRLAHKE